MQIAEDEEKKKMEARGAKGWITNRRRERGWQKFLLYWLFGKKTYIYHTKLHLKGGKITQRYIYNPFILLYS